MQWQAHSADQNIKELYARVICNSSSHWSAPSGVRTQMLQTKAALEKQWRNGDALRNVEGFRSIALWSCPYLFDKHGNISFCQGVAIRNMPFVVSPVFLYRRSDSVVRSPLFVLILSSINLYADSGLTTALFLKCCGWANAILPNTQAEAHLMQYAMNIPTKNIFITANGVEERFCQSFFRLVRTSV